ncbi:glycosyl transferase [Actinoplanes sp. ATCC 53533]|uniref:glycosyltransferase n=1 Tax=Actinoplanes sp. ATCC 53533 TaxID=1288362 RepID=UPI000F7B627A|nr:glycosyltransferase [Actinoplanes sp. ATCC 53533]RSM72266.1 glycosyl transferase [Actinoplanes sp. ATCC 53533]
MRVLHVISAPGQGGAGHQLRLLVRGLPHDCEVVTLARAGMVTAAIRDGGTTVHELGTGRGAATIVGLRRLIRRGRFDVVHTHLYRACVQGRFAARLAGVRHIVATAYHLSEQLIEGRPASAGARALYLAGERAGQATIAVTPAVAGRLRAWGVPEARITVIPKALDPDEFRYDPVLRAVARARLGIEPGVPVIGGVGRLAHGGGFDHLIRAVGEVPGATLLLVGDGPARVALERLAGIEGVADRVRFAGAVGHVREMLCAMDVFASPPGSATAGLVVLEALAAGLPTIYATCPPLEELAAARSAVDGAHRLSARDPQSLPRALRTEVLCHQERHGSRLPPRSAGDRYCAKAMAAAVDRVYDRVTGR